MKGFESNKCKKLFKDLTNSSQKTMYLGNFDKYLGRIG